MINLYWVKFKDDGTIACVCVSKDGCVKNNSVCEEFLLKLIKVDRGVSDTINDTKLVLNKFVKTQQKLVAELSKTIDKFKVRY